MRNTRLVCGMVVVLLSIGKVQAQTDGYRPKIAEFSYQFLSDYNTTSNSERFGDAASELDRDALLKIKLGVPIVMKDKSLFGLQLKYYRQRFNFDGEDFNQPYDLYDHLNAKRFTNLGLRFLYQHKLDDNREITFASGGEIRGDQIEINRNNNKFFLSGQYKKRVNENTRIGFGAYASYGFGLFSAYPIFTYEKSLNSKWTVDLTLPKSASIRRKFNPSTFLIAEVGFQGWRYDLTQPFDDSSRNFTLRKADLEFKIKFEKEIHDWLWFGVDLGFNKNVSFYLAEPGNRGRNALIDLRARDTRQLKFSIFIVPPKKLSGR